MSLGGYLRGRDFLLEDARQFELRAIAAMTCAIVAFSISTIGR